MKTEQASPPIEQVREFVIAGHGNLQKIKEMLAANPGLLNASYGWGDKDNETAIQASAQVGNASVAEFLLEKGAPMEICTAAMLGRVEIVKNELTRNPSRANALGAHGIPLLPHSVWSGNLDLVRFVHSHGATTGANLAFHNAIVKGNPEIVSWLLDNAGADVSSKNYQGKSALAVARERGNESLVKILKDRGAPE